MAEKKNYPKMVLHIVQLVCLVLLLNAVETQNWYSGKVSLDYVEGIPTNTSIEVNLDVDKDSADGSIRIDGFLSYRNWQNIRNDTTIPSDEVMEESDFEVTPLSEIQETLPILVKIAIAMTSLMVILCYYGINYRSLFGILNTSMAFYILFTLIILAPIGYFGDFDYTSGMQMDRNEGESSVHQSFDGSPEISISDNLELNYIFTTDGYDLGLVNTSQLDDVIENEPSEDHRSYYKIDGIAGIEYSAFVTEYLWACAVLFFAVPFGISFRDRVKIDKPVKMKF